MCIDERNITYTVTENIGWKYTTKYKQAHMYVRHVPTFSALA